MRDLIRRHRIVIGLTALQLVCGCAISSEAEDPDTSSYSDGLSKKERDKKKKRKKHKKQCDVDAGGEDAGEDTDSGTPAGRCDVSAPFFAFPAYPYNWTRPQGYIEYHVSVAVVGGTVDSCTRGLTLPSNVEFAESDPAGAFDPTTGQVTFAGPLSEGQSEVTVWVQVAADLPAGTVITTTAEGASAPAEHVVIVPPWYPPSN